jgi:hypothetical protein
MADPPTSLEQQARHDQLIARLLLGALIAGVAWRLVRFGLGLQLWGDEAYLAVNVVERDYADLLRPLDNRQVSPPLFLFAARWVWVQFESLTMLRLPSLASGLAAVGVFAWLVFKNLPRRAAWWALVLFAVSYPVSRYASEFKQYAGDALVSVTVMALAAAALRHLKSEISNHRSQMAPLLYLGLLIPIMLWFSYPAVAVVFGIGLVVLAALIMHKARTLAWVGWGACVLAAGAAFGALYIHVIQPSQSAESREYLHLFWAGGFPPYDKPYLIPWWLIEVHTGKMFGHPVGDKNFGSVGTTLLFITGIIALLRSGSARSQIINHKSQMRWLLAIALAPMLAGLAMSFAGVYPYGVHPRVMLYLAPSICLLAGVGIDQIALWLREDHRRIFELVTAIVMLCIPMGGMFDNAMTKRDQLKQADLAGFIDQLNTDVGADDVLVCFNKLDPHTGPGPKIQFELYIMTQLKPPMIDDAHLPDAALASGGGGGGRLFAMVYSKGPITDDSKARQWLNMLADRYEVAEIRQTFVEGDAGEQVTVVVHRRRTE